MTRFLVLAAALLLSACQVLESPVGGDASVATYSIEDFLDTTSFRGASFSSDRQRILVSSNETGVFNVYALATDGSGSEALTHSTTDALHAETFFPADDRFLYSADQGGNELHHLFVRELDGSVRDLTPGEGHKAAFAGFSHDGSAFYVLTNERDAKYFDLYEYGAEGYARERIFTNDEGYSVAAISGDGQQVALVKSLTRTNEDVYLFERETGALRHLTPHEGEVSYAPQEFQSDGERLLLLTDAGSEFRYLAEMDLASGQVRKLVDPGWDVMYAGLSHGGRYLVVGINNDARTEVKLFAAGSMQPLPLSLPLEGVDISSVTLSADESQLALYVSGAKMPGDLFVCDIQGAGLRQLTRSLSERIAPEDLVEGRVVRFESYDGVTIPGILYRPHLASAEHPVPALVWVHGGPGGQSRQGYFDLIQYLVNHGYAIYAINNRGSSGYGKTFYKLDDHQHGEADLDDCVASKAMLAELGFVDPGRIGIIGGSYGGYMVLAALAFRPREFELGVDIFGVANWVRTLESIPPWWESFRQALYQEMGDPTIDGERLHRISPVFHGENIVRPLIVLQGANDPRVLQQESDDMVAAARSAGTPVEYIVFPDEGHGFVKKDNKVKGYRAILDFCDRYLKSGPAAP